MPPQDRAQLGEVRGERGFDPHAFSGLRMVERQRPRVERLPPGMGGRLPRPRQPRSVEPTRPAGPTAVPRVAQNRMPCFGEVNPDLVRPSRFQPDLQPLGDGPLTIDVDGRQRAVGPTAARKVLVDAE